MAGAGGPLRLRDWLVAQIESGRYAGLCWEDAGKTIFRIPWKHAAKLGYQAQQDAALFRAWAVYKGKHLEGTDKEDPSTWKTRLRCALNKSADFCEVRERSQLDISNPYKVYRIVSEGAHGPVAKPCALPEKKDSPQDPQDPSGKVAGQACKPERDSSGVATEEEDKVGCLPPAALLPSPLADHRYQAQEPALSWSSAPSEEFSNPELCAHLRDGHPEPEYQIRLCFGEEYPGPPGQPEERLVMAHVEPVFARELVQHSKRLAGSAQQGPQPSIPDTLIHLLTHLSQP